MPGAEPARRLPRNELALAALGPVAAPSALHLLAPGCLGDGGIGLRARQRHLAAQFLRLATERREFIFQAPGAVPEQVRRNFEAYVYG